ncbi:MAG: hypothetical protein KAG97_10340, partial [Victivallales bacterium]|nr:hypothetical protein [Victivallales bacterium]
MGKLQLAFRTANPTLYNALEKSIIPLIEYQCDLNGLSAKEIGRINGVGAKSAELISRLISGESVHSI